jgi:hypothetical protein
LIKKPEFEEFKEKEKKNREKIQKFIEQKVKIKLISEINQIRKLQTQSKRQEG